MPQLSDFQIAVALRTPAKAKPTPAFLYDAANLDEVIAGMFHRRWDENENFPPQATRIWSVLFRSSGLGDAPDTSDVPMLMAVAENAKSDDLRHRAHVALKLHLADCSDSDSSQKTQVQILVNCLEKENMQ